MSCAAVIEVRIMPWPDHVARMGKTLNAESTVLERRRPLAKPRCRFFYLLLEIFTICFEEAIRKLFGRLLFEGRCYPVTVLRSHVTLLIKYCLLL
jgi:hypothetical protein